jgi:uncharacterized repeat protein (TIGR03803 family)
VFGTASQGGANGGGIVFKVQPKRRAESILYDFCSARNCKDGMAPAGGLWLEPDGELLGTTQSSGKFCDFGACGTVFRLSPGAHPQLTALHSFCAAFNCRDGKIPLAGATMDAAGNIYGTASEGGGNDLEDPHGGGVVFKIDTAGNFQVLHRFCAKKACTDGDRPLGDLIVDVSGNVFGTTSAGGAYGGGEVFEITP